MEFIAHRINTIKELNNLSNQFGVELDLRDSVDGNIYISHNPFETGELFSDYLKAYKHRTIILNVKSERIEYKIIELLKMYNIRQYFFLDSSFPMIYTLSCQGEKNIALRVSEYESVETAIKMSGKVDWIWLDCFNRFPLDGKQVKALKRHGYKLCIVSPELQGRDYEIERYADVLLEVGLNYFDAICTKSYNVECWKKKLGIIN